MLIDIRQITLRHDLSNFFLHQNSLVCGTCAARYNRINVGTCIFAPLSTYIPATKGQLYYTYYTHVAYMLIAS